MCKSRTEVVSFFRHNLFFVPGRADVPAQHLGSAFSGEHYLRKVLSVKIIFAIFAGNYGYGQPYKNLSTFSQLRADEHFPVSVFKNKLE